MALLLDLEALSDPCTDHALESLYKARADSVGDEGIWAAHENPWIREQVEYFTARGLGGLNALQRDLRSALNPPTVKAEPPWLRWSEKDFQAARMALEGKVPGEYALDDWLMLVDYLIQRYFPAEQMLREADYSAVRAVIAGKLQAHLEARNLPEKAVIKVAAAIPAGGTLPRLSARIQSIIQFAKARLAESVTAMTESIRHRLKSILLAHTEAMALGDKTGTTQATEAALLNTFGELNRDWRRIAITETGRAVNEGYVASLPEGARLKRMEAYATACPFCRKIHGTVVTVVSPDKPDKDWDREIWLGKTNLGRSASPRKRVGNQLVPREADELWTITPGLIHPNCRGTWSRVSEAPPAVSKDFKDWMDGLLAAGNAG